MDAAALTNRLRLLAKRALFGLGSLPYAWLTRQPIWRSHTAALVDFAGVNPEDVRQVVDLGCGPGTSAFGLADRLPRARVVGVDLSPQMIALSRRYAAREPPHPGGLEFVVADARRMPAESGTVDLVTGHSFVYLVGDDAGLGAELSRVLRPGGRCVFLEPSGEPFPLRLLARALRDTRFVLSMVLWRTVSRGAGRFTRARFEQLFRAAGLETLSVTPTLDGLGLVGAARKPG